MGRKKQETVHTFDSAIGLADYVNDVIGIPGLMAPASSPQFIKPKIPSGSWILDEMLFGGYRLGRMYHFYGPEGVGKSLFAMMALAKHQEHARSIGKMPLVAVFDYENAWDPEFASFLGIDTDMVLLAKPEYGEKGFDAIQAACLSGKFCAIMVDSIAAMIPKHDLQRALEDKTMGTLAQMMSQGLRKIVTATGDCSVFFINQIREKLGVMFGSPTTTPGGKAMGFYCSLSLEFKMGSIDKQEVKKLDAGKGEYYDSYEPWGHEIKITSKKDRTGSRRGAESSVWWKYVEHPEGAGIHEWDELWTLGFMYCEKCLGHIQKHTDKDHEFRGIISKDARTYKMPTLGVEKVVGWDECRSEIRDHPERIIHLREKISKAIEIRQAAVYGKELRHEEPVIDESEADALEQEIQEQKLVTAGGDFSEDESSDNDDEGFEPA